MKTFLLFIISFFITVGYGQNKKDFFLLENKGFYPKESFRDFKTETVLLDKNRFTGLQSISNSTNKKTLPQSFQSNSRVFSKLENYTLQLDKVVQIYFDQDDISGKIDAILDINGRLTLYTYYSWDTATQSFVPSYKTEFTYDVNGNQTLYINYYWDTATQSFVLNSKQEFAYDVNGNQTLYINYYWDTATQSFAPSYKYESDFDVNGNKTLSISHSWDTATQSFAPYSKQEIAYDVNGNQTLSISYSWDTANQSFVPNYKTEYTYDLDGNMTLETNYIWYVDLGVYKPRLKKEYATVLDNETKLVTMGTIFKYDTDFNVWNELVGEEFKSYFYYTKTASLSTETIENNLISLYPNPTSQLLYISHPEINSLGVQIVDLNGKQMYSGTIEKDVPLDVSTYTQGVYFVTIENKETNKKKTYKIIKK